jgi:cyclopropane-fatty-acyl-phospholipid synthase
MLTLLDLRTKLTDRHLVRLLWSVWIQPVLLGRIRGDKKSIREHYDLESEFFLKFVEQKTHCYSHGYFEHDDETLEDAVQRKLDTAIACCGIKPGWRVLDIGAGWGTFVEHAGRRGIDVTSLTISSESERYVSELIGRHNLPCRVLLEHFMDHRADERYDAIVNLGVTEHLPDYPATLRQYERLLKPGGRVFLDACGSYRKHSVSSWTRKHIWTGTSQFLQLSRYVRAVEKSGMELVWAKTDRRSYMLTMKHWAQNLERNQEEICARWGEELYRRYRIYLWGGAHMLKTGRITAYRILLELPKEEKRIRPRIRPHAAAGT